jgi:hypothetical protein
MVHVKLEQDWTDTTGAAHSAGDTIEVDAVTLAELEAAGVVTAEQKDDKGGRKDSWAGPT